MKTILFKVNDDFHKEIKLSAKNTNRTVSQYIRDVLSTGSHPFVTQTLDKCQ